MEIEKIELSDNEMENLPLFFKTIYHNLLIDSNFEEKLMMYNPCLLYTSDAADE